MTGIPAHEGPDVHRHTARVSWLRNDAPFTDNRYSRGHQWSFDGGIRVPASSSPSVVALPYSVAEAVDPEGDFFGEKRIASHIEEHADGGAVLVSELFRTLDRFSAGRPQPDDLTVLTASFG